MPEGAWPHPDFRLPEPDFRLVGTEYGPLPLWEIEERHAEWHAENPTRDCYFDEPR